MAQTLLDSTALHAHLRSLSKAIASAAPRDVALGVIGVRRRGEVMAQRMLPMLREHGLSPMHGALDITLYRDDLTTIGPNAILRGTEIDFNITGAWLVLVDDVLYTGRSIRAALDALVDLGRPRAIRLAVLVDRGHRELPIQPDFVALTTPTEAHHIIKVQLKEVDGVDGVELVDTR